MKQCKICEQDKPENEFYNRRSSRNGKYYYSTYCKPCERKKAKEFSKARYSDPQIRAELLNKARQKSTDPEYRRQRSRRFQEKYKNLNFRQKILDRMKENRADPVKNQIIRQRAAAYYQNHKQEIYERSRQKDELDPRRRLRGFMRSRINEALKVHGKSKDDTPSLAYLGYSWADLYDHLEAKFEDWMTWDNYGHHDNGLRTWNVDHIIPQAYFPYDSMDCELFKKCWSLDNLRPYDSINNFADGNREGLLGPVRNIESVLNEIRKYKNDPIIKETPQQIIEAGRNIPGVTIACPMSMIGLSYLDSIFAVRFAAKTSNFQSLNEAVSDDSLLLKVIRHLIIKGSVVTSALVLGNLRYVVRTPGHFFPMAAISIYKRYGGERVFDPFLGWGGRTLGALCSNVKEFVGCDLQEEVVDGCRKMSRDFIELSNTKIEFQCADSLEFLRSQTKGLDLIFTSPPFMDTESYNIESDSMRQEWLDSFIFPFMEECVKKLNPDGKLALHLKDIKGAPTFTAYHAATKAVGLKQIDRHKYGRTWTQAIYVYSKI